MAGWGRAIQTMQQVIKVGSSEVVLTHNRHLPMFMNTLNDVLLNSNQEGESAPCSLHTVPTS